MDDSNLIVPQKYPLYEVIKEAEEQAPEAVAELLQALPSLPQDPTPDYAAVLQHFAGHLIPITLDNWIVNGDHGEKPTIAFHYKVYTVEYGDFAIKAETNETLLSKEAFAEAVKMALYVRQEIMEAELAAEGSAL